VIHQQQDQQQEECLSVQNTHVECSDEAVVMMERSDAAFVIHQQQDECLSGQNTPVECLMEASDDVAGSSCQKHDVNVDTLFECVSDSVDESDVDLIPVCIVCIFKVEQH